MDEQKRTLQIVNGLAMLDGISFIGYGRCSYII